jgi:purine nucleoside phosphorylase
VVQDQIACFDPTVMPVRDANGRAVFPEMSEPFDADTSEKAFRAAEKWGLAVRTGCVAGLREPGLLTPAEWTALQSLGADAVCRWLHLAVRRARAAGRPVCGLGVRPGLDAGSVQALLSVLV